MAEPPSCGGVKGRGLSSGGEPYNISQESEELIMIQSRRQFFHRLPALGALPASWVSFASALAAPAIVPNSENYWRMVKRQFPLESRLIYLNAANVCPASRPVLNRPLEFLRDFRANPSSPH